MKAISIQQPWAELILSGGKDVENRTWPTRHRGLVLIHAGRSPDRSADDVWDDWDNTTKAPVKRTGPSTFNALPMGCIVGVAKIIGCVQNYPGPWFCGPWGFVLRQARPFPRPVPWRGKLYLFDVPDDDPAILEQLDLAGHVV